MALLESGRSNTREKIKYGYQRARVLGPLRAWRFDRDGHLPPPVRVRAADPRSIMPQFGPLAPIYEDPNLVRAKIDGLDLLNRELIGPRKKIEQAYLNGSAHPDFQAEQAEQFVDRHFKKPDIPPLVDFQGGPGISIDMYTHKTRKQFILKPHEQPNGHTIRMKYPVMVAGYGRFYGHQYAWDVGHQNNGLRVDSDWRQILYNALNQEHLINKVGIVANANTKFYATRGQMPYFHEGVAMLYEKVGPKAIERFLPAVEKDYRTRMDGLLELATIPEDGKAHAVKGVVRMPDGSILNRYYDSGSGPRPEMAVEDIRDAQNAIAIKKLKGAEAQTEADRIYANKRAGAASGRDFTVEWLLDPNRPESICVTDITPVDLNCKMYDLEKFIALGYAIKARSAKGLARNQYLKQSEDYQKRADTRWESIVKHNYIPEEKLFRNYNFKEEKHMPVLSSSMAWVLLYGNPNAEQAFGVKNALEQHLLYPGGIIATNAFDSLEQWDGLNVWGPNNFAAARGAARMAHRFAPRAELLRQQGYDIEELFGFAETVKHNYTWGNSEAYAEHGVIPEKINGQNPRIMGSGGEYEAIPVFSMAIETNYALSKWDPREVDGVLPIDPLARVRKQYGLAA